MIDPLFDENFNLWIMIQQTRDALWAAREKELSNYGLSPIEMAVLFYIQIIERTTDRKTTATEIARWLFRKRNSISELLGRMEKKGLVKKIRDLDKKNSVRITLAEKGQQLYSQAMEGQIINKLLSSLSEEERRHLWPGLGRLRNNAIRELGISQKPPFPQFL